MKCADSSPWDASILCELTPEHDGLHEAYISSEVGFHRWADFCHWPGDDCGPLAHPVEAGGAA